MVLSAAQEAGGALPEAAQRLRRRRWRGRARPASTPGGDWPDLIGLLLALRGMEDAAGARRFLAAPGAMPGCEGLPAIDAAIDRLLRACRQGEQVALYGDFDVDGVTSVAQLHAALRALGARPVPYIPDRFSEGYGLNTAAITELARGGSTLLVTLDCGTSNVDEVAAARRLGLDTIIVDHHTTPPVLPDVVALVNPKLPGAQAGDLGELATAGLAFHIAGALHAAAGRPFEEDAYLDAAALGTVCDMAPLTGENRRIVRSGLGALARTARPGLRALIEVSRIEGGSVTADDIGYRLGPRLNAAGRVAHARLALELLLSEDGTRARELALRLEELNRERQERTLQAVALATHMLEGREVPALVMVGHADFSSGIVGLIASRLVTLYGRPAVVYEQGPEYSRASCRSIDDFHITDALRARPDLFVRFGGHRAAAGFTVETARLDEVRAHLEAHAARELAGRELAPVLEIDAQLPLRHLRGHEIRWLMQMGPFGVGNPCPTFLARDLRVLESRVVGNGTRHLKLKLRDGNMTWPAMAFDMGDAVCEPGDRVDVVYTLEPRADGTLDIRIEDLRAAESVA